MRDYYYLAITNRFIKRVDFIDKQEDLALIVQSIDCGL